MAGNSRGVGSGRDDQVASGRSSLRGAARNLLLLTTGQGLYRISALLLVSMYAHALGPSAFGQLEQLLALSLLVTPLVSLQVYEAFLSALQRDRREGFSVATAIFLGMSALCLVAGGLVAFVMPSHAPVVIAFTAHVITTTAWQIMRNFLRASQRLDVTAQSEALQAVASLSLGAFFLHVLGWGVIGVLVAVAVANMCAALFAGLRCIERGLLSRSAISHGAFSSVLGVSLRLVPNVALWWGIELSDRLILAHFAGDHAVGIYSAGARIAGIFMSAMLLLYQLWQIPAIEALHRGDRAFFVSTLRPFAVMVALSASGLLVAAQPLTALLLGQEYADSRRFTAVLVCASCLAMWCYFLGIVYYSSERVSAVRASVTGLAASVAVNVAFIPILGSIAAAWAAFLAYAVMAAMRFVEARGLLGVSMPWRSVWIPSVVLTAQAIGLYHGVASPLLLAGTVALALLFRGELFTLLRRLQGRLA